MHAFARSLVVLSLTTLSAFGCKRKSAPPSAQDEARRTFAMVCGRCHGPDGRGGVVMGVSAAPPNLRDPAFHAGRTDAELAAVIRDGKGAMPAFGNLYTPEQIAALVEVVRGFEADKR